MSGRCEASGSFIFFPSFVGSSACFSCTFQVFSHAPFPNDGEPNCEDNRANEQPDESPACDSAYDPEHYQYERNMSRITDEERAQQVVRWVYQQETDRKTRV